MAPVSAGIRELLIDGRLRLSSLVRFPVRLGGRLRQKRPPAVSARSTAAAATAAHDTPISSRFGSHHRHGCRQFKQHPLDRREWTGRRGDCEVQSKGRGSERRPLCADLALSHWTVALSHSRPIAPHEAFFSTLSGRRQQVAVVLHAGLGVLHARHAVRPVVLGDASAHGVLVVEPHRQDAGPGDLSPVPPRKPRSRSPSLVSGMSGG